MVWRLQGREHRIKKILKRCVGPDDMTASSEIWSQSKNTRLRGRRIPPKSYQKSSLESDGDNEGEGKGGGWMLYLGMRVNVSKQEKTRLTKSWMHSLPLLNTHTHTHTHTYIYIHTESQNYDLALQLLFYPVELIIYLPIVLVGYLTWHKGWQPRRRTRRENPIFGPSSASIRITFWVI